MKKRLLAPGHASRASWLWPVALAAAVAGPPAQSRPYQVNLAIESGVKWLKKRQKEDGTFPGGNTEGVCALALLTFIKSGVKRTDPAVQRCIEFLVGKPYHATYETSVRLLAWESLRDPKWLEEIEIGTDALLETFNEEHGGWDYPGRHVDLSNTQYAVLGLWAAHRLGVTTPTGIWVGLAQATLRYQNADGGFGYRIGNESSGSMTTAGITVLLVARDQGVELDGHMDGALARAWQYLEQRYVPGGCAGPEGNPVGSTAYQYRHLHYYLYGIERICAIADRQRLGEHDWYARGADFLVESQNKKNGTWGDEVGTCFSLLFLRRSTFTTLRKVPVPTMADGDAPGPAPTRVRVAAHTPFVRSWLVRGPFRDEASEPLEKDFIREATASPTSSGGGWVRHDSATRFVDLQQPLGVQDHCAAYAFVWLHAKEDFRGYLWFDSDDGARILIDGELVFERNFRQGARADKRRIPITLAKGVHRVLVKVIEYVGDWGFFFRITDEQGKPPDTVLDSLSSPAPGAATWRRLTARDAPLEEVIDLLPASKKTVIDFATARDLQRVVVRQASTSPPPVWMESAELCPPGAPMPCPGARGILGLHPLGGRQPAQIVRKMTVPESRNPRLSVRACAEAGGGLGESDFVLRLLVHVDGKTVKLAEQVIASAKPATRKGWVTVQGSLADYAGREVLIVVECAAGGRHDWHWEHALIDWIRVR